MDALQLRLSTVFRRILKRKGHLPPDLLAAELALRVPSTRIKARDLGLFLYHGYFDESFVVEAESEIVNAHLSLPLDVSFTISVSNTSASLMALLALIGTLSDVRSEGRFLGAHAKGVIDKAGLALVQVADYRSIDDAAWVKLDSVKSPLCGDDAPELNWERHIFDLCARRASSTGPTYLDRCVVAPLRFSATQAVNEGFFDAVAPLQPYRK